MYCHCIHVTLVFLIIFTSRIDGDNNTKTIVEDILHAYNKMERPVALSTQTLDVLVNPKIRSFSIGSDGTEMSLLVQMKWRDYNVVWDPNDHENVSTVKISPIKIWKPDIHLLNVEGPGHFEGMLTALITADFNGTMTVEVPGKFFVFCKTSLVDYPFDEYNCELQIGSWSHSANEIHVKMDGPNEMVGDKSEYIEHPEFNLIEFSARENISKSSKLILTIRLQRNGESIMHVLKLLIVMICSLALVSCAILPSVIHKIIFGLVALSLCMYTIHDIAQAAATTVSNNKMLTVVAFCTNLFILLICVVATNCGAIYIHNLKTHLPKWISSFQEYSNSFCVIQCMLAPSFKKADISSTSMEMTNESEFGEISGSRSHFNCEERSPNSIGTDWAYFAKLINLSLLVFWSISIATYLWLYYPTR